MIYGATWQNLMRFPEDGLGGRLKIREDAKFADGCAVEAEDFVATWDVMQEYQPRPFASVEATRLWTATH